MEFETKKELKIAGTVFIYGIMFIIAIYIFLWIIVGFNEILIYQYPHKEELINWSGLVVLAIIGINGCMKLDVLSERVRKRIYGNGKLDGLDEKLDEN